jgi:septum formation protein
MKTIVLASTSPRRAALLKQIGLDFTVVASNVVEEGINLANPRELAEKLALVKAGAVAAKHKESLVIAADTVVCVDGQTLGKPRDALEAAAMLRSLSGRGHHVLTGVAVIDSTSGRLLTHVEDTRVFMRGISEEEIGWYVASGEPYDKAGGYGIQGKAAIFVERLEGCYFNVVGLPLAALWQMLKSLGIKVWEGASR